MITLFKTGTYSIMHITVAFIVAYTLTGDVRTALGISLVEPLVQTFFFFFHEKAWNKIALSQKAQ